jgi:CHAD domain-containing protein
MAQEIPDQVQRWTAKRRAALRFLLAAENALRSRPKNEEGLKEERIKQLERKIGGMVLDMDILEEALKGRPFGEGTSDE